MGRFFKNLKLKTLSGAGGPTSSELRDTGKTIYLENKNTPDLDELILVQKAHYYQTQNGAGLPHPGLGGFVEEMIDDSGTAVSILIPQGFQIFRIVALTVSNASGGSATVTVEISDGSASMAIASGTVADGATTVLLSPLETSYSFGAGSASSGLLIDSSLQLAVKSTAEVIARAAYQTLSNQ